MTDRLDPLPEDWERGLAVVAHPDDMEYGAASAVARWTRQGKAMTYLLVTDGEAGVASMSPGAVSRLRREEQRASCAVVGVHQIEFLGHPDGMVVANLALRADLAERIRRHRPEVIVSINFRDSWGGTSWNHVDHRSVGVALLDAVRDAANPWVFPERGDPWTGVRFVAFSGSPQPTHAVDIAETIDVGIASLECHRVYLENLEEPTDPDAFLRGNAARTGPRLAVALATAFEMVTP